MDFSDYDHDERGRRLGHDIHTFSRWTDTDAWPSSVREGYAHARSSRAKRGDADRFLRKWLQLRLGALERGLAMDEGVTPQFLREIDVPTCPVMREPLTHGSRQGSDWSVDRLNNDGAYAVNNLAVMSVRANAAKGSRGFGEVLALSKAEHPHHGLTPTEWLRMASMMLAPCFSTNAAEAPLIPALTPIPTRSVRIGAQLVQHVWAQQARSSSGKNATVKAFRQASTDERAERALQRVADRVHHGLKNLDTPWDVWMDERAMAALACWRAQLGEHRWAATGAIAARMLSAKVVPTGRLSSWRLNSSGGRHHAVAPVSL